MERVCCVLVLSLQLVLSQYAQSPCPALFDYAGDGAYVYGLVQLTPTSPVSSLTIRTIFTVAAQLFSNYVGRIDAEGNLLQKYNAGVPVTVRVHFPVTSPLPRLAALTVNEDTICYDPSEVPRPGQNVTTLSLQHTSYLLGDDNIASSDTNDTLQRRPDPVVYDAHAQVFTVNSFDSNQAWSNYNTSYYKNNTQTILHQSTRPNYDLPTHDRPTVDRPPFKSFNERRPSTRRPVQIEQPVSNTPRTEPSTRLVTTSRPPATNLRPTPPSSRRPAPQSKSVECGVVSGGNENLPLIYNGQAYSRGEMPWLVAIYKRRMDTLFFTCGGTLVSDRHVVTAAHCILLRSELTSIKDLIIKLGVQNLHDWLDEIAILRTVVVATIHEAYNASLLDNDLLVLTLNQKVEFNNYIRPVCLWFGNTDINYVVRAAGVVVGWGPLDDPSGLEGGIPHIARLPIVRTAECKSNNTHSELTSPNIFCAEDRNKAISCKGVAGGGLYLLESGKWRLRGVVSRSLINTYDENTSCNLSEYIVFTDTAKYLDWIKEKLVLTN